VDLGVQELSRIFVCYIKTEEVIQVDFKVEFYNYNDGPVDYWEAHCKQLGLVATGKTNKEAKVNLYNLILNTKFYGK
jgi:hypothetical protein